MTNFSLKDTKLWAVASVLLAVQLAISANSALAGVPLIYAESVNDNPDGSFTVVAPMAQIDTTGDQAVILKPGTVEIDSDPEKNIHRYAMFADDETANYVCNNLSPDKIKLKKKGYKNYGPFRAEMIQMSKATAKELKTLVPPGAIFSSLGGIIQSEPVAKRMAATASAGFFLQTPAGEDGLDFWKKPPAQAIPSPADTTANSTQPAAKQSSNKPAAIYWILCKPSRPADRNRRKAETANVERKNNMSLAQYVGLGRFRHVLVGADSKKNDALKKEDQAVATGTFTRNLIAAGTVLIDPHEWFHIIFNPALNFLSTSDYEIDPSEAEERPSDLHGFSSQSDPNGVCRFFGEDMEWFDGGKYKAPKGYEEPPNLLLAKLTPAKGTAQVPLDTSKTLKDPIKGVIATESGGTRPLILQTDGTTTVTDEDDGSETTADIPVGQKGHYYDLESKDQFATFPLVEVDKKGEIIKVHEPERVKGSLVEFVSRVPAITRIACKHKDAENRKKKEDGIMKASRGM